MKSFFQRLSDITNTDGGKALRTQDARLVLLAFSIILSSAIFAPGCEKSKETMNIEDLRSGLIDSVTLELLPEKVIFDGFSIRTPRGFDVLHRGKEFTRERDDLALEIKGKETSSVLLYRMSTGGKVAVREFVVLVGETSAGAFGIETEIESYKKIVFKGRQAIVVDGTWASPGGESPPFRAIGFECGKYYYIINSVIRSGSGEWDPLPWKMTNTFQCGDD